MYFYYTVLQTTTHSRELQDTFGGFFSYFGAESGKVFASFFVFSSMGFNEPVKLAEACVMSMLKTTSFAHLFSKI